MAATADETPTDTAPGGRTTRGRITLVLAIVLVVGLLVGGGTLLFRTLSGPSGPPAPQMTAVGPIESLPAPPPTAIEPQDGSAEGTLAASPPTSISIPGIDVESVVNEVGLNPDRTLEVPQPGPEYDDAAWYRGSVTPGELGPSVIIGHVDSAANGPSVFYDLGAVVPGSAFSVTREDGSVLNFRVDSVRTYPKNDFPTQTVYGGTTRPELRLITCGGPFDSSAGSYEDNTVVFAHLIA